MIAAKVALDEAGRIERFEASGHAGTGPKGHDLACAAFTLFARSAYEALAAQPGALLDYEAPEPGVLRFRVVEKGRGDGERAAGIADLLLAGIAGLEREFPGAVSLTIEEHWRD